MFAGLTDLDGNQHKTSQIDIIADAESMGASPATLAHIIRHETSHLRRDPKQVSASESGNGVRYMYFSRTVEEYPTVASLMAALEGTARHERINVGDDPRLIIEERLQNAVKTLSGQPDHAAITGWDWDADAETVYIEVDLYDLKTGGSYARERFEAAPGTHDITYQVNLYRVLLEAENGEFFLPMNTIGEPQIPDVCLKAYHDGAEIKVRVQNMFVEWRARDVMRAQWKKALAVGDPDPRNRIIQVPYLTDEAVMAYYRDKQEALVDALHSGTAPVCSAEERWDGKKGPARCEDYCPFLDDCREMSILRGETHPLDGGAS